MASSALNRPRLLDLGCCAGGASVGYERAGFEVEGVDIAPMPRYPFKFHLADALEFLSRNADRYDAIHGSPPCQRFSSMSSCRPGLGESYPDLVAPWREALDEIGKPYILENVVGAPLKSPIMLCGQMFGLELYRHRLFESNVALQAPPHPEHTIPASRAGHWVPGTVMSVAGHVAPISQARRAMGIDWMNRDELSEAIPPAYSEYVGTYLIEEVRNG